jgi:glycosyltransferase involved in cell wall biosynthesis
MRIAILNDFCSRNGGAASVAIDSALGLAKAGHEVRFIGMVGPVDPSLAEEPLIQVYCANQVAFLDDSNRTGAALRGLWSISAKNWITSVLSDWQGMRAIVHVHGWVKAFSPSIFAAFLGHAHWCSVITLHDYFIACPNGGFINYPQTQICTRIALSASCLSCNCDPRSYAHKIWRYGRGLIQTHGLDIASRVDGLVGVSHFAVDKLKPYLKSGVPVSVVRNPINLNRPRVLGGNPDGSLIYVGRLSPEKGVDLALSAARRLGRKLIVLGEGSLRKELNLAYPEADFRGWAHTDDVYKAMSGASALVFPSRWYETNGLVVLEAMAHGLPVVISDGCASTEFVRDGVTGRHFKLGSVESLTTVLSEVLAGQGGSLGSAAAEWYWNDPWTLTAHVSELEKFYNQLWSQKCIKAECSP